MKTLILFCALVGFTSTFCGDNSYQRLGSDHKSNESIEPLEERITIVVEEVPPVPKLITGAGDLTLDCYDYFNALPSAKKLECVQAVLKTLPRSHKVFFAEELLTDVVYEEDKKTQRRLSDASLYAIGDIDKITKDVLSLKNVCKDLRELCCVIS